MTEPKPPKLYIRFYKRVVLPPGRPIVLGHIAKLLIDPSWEERLNKLHICTPDLSHGNMLLIDMLTVIRHIQTVLPHIAVEHVGEPHVLVELKGAAGKPNYVMILLVCLLLFVGSGMAIMNFHADVSMMEVHQKVYALITGKHVAHPYVLQIPYSIGLGAGMIIFFNRIFKKKFNEEPTPLEVEIFTYQENVDQYVISNEYRAMREGRDRDSHDRI